MGKRNAFWTGARIAAAVAVVLCLGGCTSMGPRMLRNTRVDYNNALSASWNEQLLLNVVRAKYGEPPLFLELGSITTQYSLEAGAAINPIWPRPDAVTDSVTRAAGAVSRTTTHGPGSGDEYKHGVTMNYFERPTATFSPLQGKDYVMRLMSPIPLQALVLLSASGWSVERVFSMCMQRVNGVPNAPSASGPTPELSPKYEEFARAVALLRELQLEDSLNVEVKAENDLSDMVLVIDPIGNDPRRSELRELLKLSKEATRIVVKPAWVGNPAASDGEVLVAQTRSLLGVFHYLGNAVEVPEEDVKNGLVVKTTAPDGSDFDWKQVVGKIMCVHSAESAPANAYVSVRYRGHWFYLSDDDLNSKSTFAFLASLFNLQAGDRTAAGPLLTLPVSN